MTWKNARSGRHPSIARSRRAPGHGFHEAMVHEKGKRDAEAPVDHPEAADRVRKVEGFGHLHQRDHEGLEGNHHWRHAQEEDEPAVAGLRARELVPGKRSQEHDAAAVPRHVTIRVLRKRFGYP